MADYNKNNRSGGYGKSGGFNGSGNKSNFGGNGSGGNGGTVVSLPVGYLANGYRKADGSDDLDYILKFAKDIGTKLTNDRTTGVSKIRSYYDTVVTCKEAMYNGMMDVATAKKRISKLIPNIHSRFDKGTASALFRDFITENVNYVVYKSNDDAEFKRNLTDFCDHFEAVVCYIKTSTKTNR